MMPVALETKNLNLYYSDFHALKNVDFKVYANRITALIGPSGCGKSTLLRCFNRMNDLIDEVKVVGDLFVNNDHIDAIDLVELRRKVGMVFQRPNPFPFTVLENMTYGLKIHGKSNKKKNREVIERCLNAVGLWDDMKDKLHKIGRAHV